MAASPDDRSMQAESRTTHRCRACGQPVDETSGTFPFCSNRCRWSDLGKWFDGEYRISREIKDSDLETVD